MRERVMGKDCWAGCVERDYLHYSSKVQCLQGAKVARGCKENALSKENKK